MIESDETRLFYSRAKVTHSYGRRDSRVRVQRCKYDIMFGPGKFRGMQRLADDETGEVRFVVKIEHVSINK